MLRPYPRSKFVTAERNIGALLKGKGDRKKSVAALGFLRDHHGLTAHLPAKVRINVQTLAQSDLPRRGKHINRTVDVHLRDCLDLDQLDGLKDRFGAPGDAARGVFLDAFQRYLRTRIAATDYQPWNQTVDERTYVVHNDLVTLHANWGHQALRELSTQLRDNQVFALEFPDERFGLARTSATTTNPDMLRQWTLDSCMLWKLQADQRPDLWPRSLITNCGFHITPENVAAARRTVDRPKWFREGDAKCGIAHIFLPSPTHHRNEGLRWNERDGVAELGSIEQDPAWGNRQRLESQAILVHRACSTLAASGPGSPHVWRFPWETMTEMQKQYVIKAIQVVMPYLLAVQWDGKQFDFRAPTVSSWEEAPFPGGCASDTGFMVDAAKSLRRLLAAGDTVPAEVLQRLKDHCSTEWDRRLRRSPFADFRRPGVLDSYIAAGEACLSRMVVQPIVAWIDHVSLAGIGSSVPTGIKQFQCREADTSLCVLAAHHESFSANPLWDALIRYGLVRFAETHLTSSRFASPAGLWRYGAYSVPVADGGNEVVFDSYLNLGFHHALLVPGMFAPWFASMIDVEESRLLSRGLPGNEVTPRDQLIRRAAERFRTIRSAAELRSKKDATSIKTMVERQHLSLPEWTAQWTIGPTASVMALAKAKRGILQVVKTHGRDEQVLAALRAVEVSLVKMLNLSLSTIVGNKDSARKPVFRADGTTLPARYNVMEAFQVALDVSGNERLIPGEHTLPWSSSQLFQGIELASMAAAEAEQLGL